MDGNSELKSVRRAIEILRYLADGTDARSFTEIREGLKLTKATANRFLTTLEDLGMVQRSAETGKYRLGMVALRIGVSAGNQMEFRMELRPFLRELTQRTGETSNLTVLDGTRPVFVDNVESPQNIRMLSRIGRGTSPYSTSAGKVLLAYSPPELLERVFEREPFEQRTPNTIVTREAFIAELARVREVGYAVDDEEGEVGARCVGAPVFDHSGKVVAGLSISGPTFRVSRDDFPRLGEIVRSIAAQASMSLGYQKAE